MDTISLMKDLNGVRLKKGDIVAVSVGGRYHDFYIAKVTDFTTKMVKVESIGIERRSWNRGIRTINPNSCVIILNGRKSKK